MAAKISTAGPQRFVQREWEETGTSNGQQQNRKDQPIALISS